MTQRNPNFARLAADYLFPKVEGFKERLLERDPSADIINLGIGNTTEPLSTYIKDAMAATIEAMSTQDGYHGYGPIFGEQKLREAIASEVYGGRVDPHEVYVSDGAKCDVGRLQLIFNNQKELALQDPAYPAYIATRVITGGTGSCDEETGQYAGITYLPCTDENAFFPDLSALKEGQVIFFCSPNNPTGAVATREQLTDLVAVAKEKRCLIIFDSAYSAFIRDPELPTSIYETPGATEVAIETGSFSKSAGFTGLRLGWTVVPKALKFEDGTPVSADWEQVMKTFYNGASYVVQQGGIAALSKKGQEDCRALTDFYLENAKILKDCFETMGLKTYGGDNCPYVWVKFPGKRSWDLFEEILNKAHIVTTPGVGFGPAGEGFIRVSGFGSRARIEEAAQRLSSLWVAN